MPSKLRDKNGGFIKFIVFVIIVILLMKYFDVSIKDMFYWIWAQIQSVF